MFIKKSPVNRYISFIEHCKKKKYHQNEYLENHHIIPRHEGGSNNKDNLIKLSLKDHIQAHKIRYEAYGNKYDYSAYNYMLGQSAEAKKAICSENGKKSKGRKLTEEHKQKLREASSGERNHFYGKTHSEESINKIREKAIGRQWTEESKNKLSNTLKNNAHITGARRCKINGIEYISANEASKKLNIDRRLLKYRLDSYKYENYIWIDASKENKRNYNSVLVEIDGKVFPSINKAAQELKMHPATIKKRCLNNSYPDFKFLKNP